MPCHAYGVHATANHKKLQDSACQAPTAPTTTIDGTTTLTAAPSPSPSPHYPPHHLPPVALHMHKRLRAEQPCGLQASCGLRALGQGARTRVRDRPGARGCSGGAGAPASCACACACAADMHGFCCFQAAGRGLRSGGGLSFAGEASHSVGWMV